MLVSTVATLRDIVFALPSLQVKVPVKYGSASSAHKELQRAIIQTISYFDIADYPLTSWEVYRCLWRKDLSQAVSYRAVREALYICPHVTYSHGFYTLQSREHIVATRKKRQVIAAHKYRRARRVVALLARLPFVEMVAVSNSLAYDNARAESDIDLFIVARPRHLWTVRCYATVLLKLLHLRPTPKTKRNKVCLNFLVTSDALNLEHLRVRDDIYLAYWLRQLTPLYDAGGVFQKLQSVNTWTQPLLGEELMRFSRRRRIIVRGFSALIKRVVEFCHQPATIERILKTLQLRKLPENIRTQANTGVGVVMTDSVLKFHTPDARGSIRDAWRKRLQNYQL